MDDRDLVMAAPPFPLAGAADVKSIVVIILVVTDAARVVAALLATRLSSGRLASPFTARAVYRNEWTGLTEPRVVRA